MRPNIVFAYFIKILLSNFLLIFIVILLCGTRLYFSIFGKDQEKYRYLVTYSKVMYDKLLKCYPQFLKQVNFANYNYSFIEMS